MIGNTIFYAVVLIVLLYVLQFPINLFLVRMRLYTSKATDERLNIIDKLIMGIRTIKTYVWEAPTIKQAEGARRK